MKKIFVCVLHLTFSNPGLAEVFIDNALIDNFYQPVPAAHSSQNGTSEYGNLQDPNSLLVNPVCTGALLSPAVITDLSAFFEGYAGARVIDRGNGHYLLILKPVITEEEKLKSTATASNTVYAELEFSAVIEGTFVLRKMPDFLSEAAMGAASCLAENVYGTAPGRAQKI